MNIHEVKGIAERKLEDLRHPPLSESIQHWNDTGTINGSFLNAIYGFANEVADEMVKKSNADSLSGEKGIKGEAGPSGILKSDGYYYKGPKGAKGPMGVSSNDPHVIIELTRMYNTLGEVDGCIYKEDSIYPEHLVKLEEVIKVVRLNFMPQEPIIEYEILLETVSGTPIQWDEGEPIWMAIETKKIKHPEKIPEYIKKGVIRKIKREVEGDKDCDESIRI